MQTVGDLVRSSGRDCLCQGDLWDAESLRCIRGDRAFDDTETVWAPNTGTGTYQQANTEVLCTLAEEAGLDEGREYGCHFESFWVLCTVSDEALIEALLRLEDYPVLDEDRQLALFVELVDEAWSSWVEREFTRDLSDFIGHEIEDWAEKDSAWNLFRRAMEEENLYEEEDSDGEVFFPSFDRIVARAAELLTDEDVILEAENLSAYHWDAKDRPIGTVDLVLSPLVGGTTAVSARHEGADPGVFEAYRAFEEGANPLCVRVADGSSWSF